MAASDLSSKSQLFSMGTATLVSNQEYLAPPTELSLEIQQGNGPFSPTVTSPVKIGDTITLVVRAKSQMKGELIILLGF